jgi:hypothetical protein
VLLCIVCVCVSYRSYVAVFAYVVQEMSHPDVGGKTDIGSFQAPSGILYIVYISNHTNASHSIQFMT